MERLFSPCTRLHDFLESQGDLEQFRMRHPELLQELNLDVSSEEFLSAERAFTYADLYATLGNMNTVAWLTPHAAVAREHQRVLNAWERLDWVCCFYRFSFSADGIEIVAAARSFQHLREICDVVVRLLAVSVVHSVKLFNTGSHDGSINAPSLAYLMEQCQSLKSLTLSRIALGEDHCRALGAYSRPDLEIVLIGCIIMDAGASALAEVLGRNQGPTKLNSCYIDNSILANGLRGNSRLQSWIPGRSDNLEVGNRQDLAITGALKENKGLVDLDLSYGFGVNDETWDAVCDSLKTHPTIEVLDLHGTFSVATTARLQALVDMLKVNMTIHTIHLDSRYTHHELFQGSIAPYLATNRFRPRVRTIQKTGPTTYRAKVLGRALLAARTDANGFWMLLSGNTEVAFPSTTATTSLPTPATAAAAATTSNAATPVATIAAVTAAATRATVADPSAHPKRKASP
jgi:hypothetical protein